MGFTNKKNQIVRIQDQWYVETRTGYEGPFEHYHEAKNYLMLINSADAARMEFAGLALSAFD